LQVVRRTLTLRSLAAYIATPSMSRALYPEDFMRAFLIISALLGLVAASSGCGEDTRSCQAACRRAFLESECNVQVPGVQSSKMTRDCIVECETALKQTGELGNYDPDNRNSVERSTPYKLANEKQAALWMDCVIETACDSLNDGYCPGGGIN